MKPIKITPSADGRYRADDGDGCVAYGATIGEAALAYARAHAERGFALEDRDGEPVEKGTH